MIIAENYPYTGNGLGGLPDALEATVTHEINGIYELFVSYPVTGLHYDEIISGRIIMAEPDDLTEAQPFRIYRITKPLNGIVSVYARHICYDLQGIIVEPFSAGSMTEAFQTIPTKCTPSSPITLQTTRSVASGMSIAEPRPLWKLLGGQAGSLLDVYGGEWDFDKLTATLVTTLGSDRGVSVRYGKNMTEMEQDASIEGSYSGVYPYWYDEESNTLVTLTEKIVPVTGSVVSSRVFVLDCSGDFDDAPTEAQLRTRAQNYITNNSIGNVSASWKISFVDTTEGLDRVMLGDTLHVYYERLDVNATARAVKVEYNVLQKRYKSITVGRVKQNLASIIVQQQEDTENALAEIRSDLETAVDDATDFIRHGAGYMRFIYNGDILQEIVSLDDPDITQAQKVWRWNNGGFGFSSTGYNGPYTLAITQNGAIVADFITAGTLNANVIRAGILQDALGKNSWNLDTGEFSLEALDSFGGRNYWWACDKKIHSEVTLSNASVAYNESKNGETVVTCTTASSGFVQSYYLANVIPVPSELIGETMSFHADSIVASSTNDPRVFIIIANSSGAQIAAHYLEPSALSKTFTMPSGAVSFRPLIRVRQTGSTAVNESVTVRGVKLERGETRTDWSPAPEDSVNGGNIISKINVSSEGITIAANKLNLTGYITATNLSTSGQTTINGANITTGIIKDAANKNSWDLSTGVLTISNGKIVATYNVTFYYTNYSTSDLTTIANIVNAGTWTDEQLAKYDFNLDGQITLADRTILNNMLTNQQNRTVSITTEVDPSKTGRPICIYDNSSNPVTYLSPNAVVAKSGSFGQRVSVGDSRLTYTGFLGLQGTNASITFYDTSGTQTGYIGNDINDYIVARGTSGDWKYRKWKSGVCECWCRRSASIAISTAWGQVYYGTLSAISYPVTFAELPFEQVSVTGGDGIAWIAGYTQRPSTTATGRYALFRPSTTAAQNYYIDYYVRGVVSS